MVRIDITGKARLHTYKYTHNYIQINKYINTYIFIQIHTYQHTDRYRYIETYTDRCIYMRFRMYVCAFHAQ